MTITFPAIRRPSRPASKPNATERNSPEERARIKQIGEAIGQQIADGFKTILKP